MKRSTLCEQFLKDSGVNCCSLIDSNDEGHFLWSGCDCCKSRHGTTIYQCHGYNPETKEVVDLGDICHDCICYFYNGDESEVAS